jgi:hypothetical protein
MKEKKKMRLFIFLLGFSILNITSSFAQVERHSFITAKEGDVYVMLKVGAPITPEQMHFLSIVNKMKNLRVLTHAEPMSDQELNAFHKGVDTYTDKYDIPDLDWDKEKVMNYQKKTTEFPMTKLEDKSMLNTLRISKFPSLLYLTPDGYTYRFSFMPFLSEEPINTFWKAYDKHKDQGQKMFLEKKWSVR